MCAPVTLVGGGGLDPSNCVWGTPPLEKTSPVRENSVAFPSANSDHSFSPPLDTSLLGSRVQLHRRNSNSLLCPLRKGGGASMLSPLNFFLWTEIFLQVVNYANSRGGPHSIKKKKIMVRMLLF
jgi:hypothetical protein